MRKASSILAVLLLEGFLSCGLLSAQETRESTHATLIGIGSVRQQDTYLSPLNYKGTQVQFLYETLRPSRRGGGRWTMQSIWQGNLSYTDSPTSNANNLGGDIGYNFAMHYNWLLGNAPAGLRLQLGPQLNVNAGALYNTRNGNNPAQAIVNAGVSVSMAAIYGFRIKRQPFLVRNQLDVPVVGLKFSPNYGQSYYEIFSEGNSDHNLCATTPFNAPCLRNLLTVDIPFRRSTLRAGYLIDIRQSHLHELKYHSYTHAFMIGWVRHISYKKSRRQMPDGFIM